jgi:SNF2 family DNA or RNA helicase
LEGASNLEELNDKLRSVCYIRRTKDQVLTELPPVFHQEMTLVGAPPAMAEYAKAEKDIVIYLVERAKEIAKELGTNPKSAAVVARIKAEHAQNLVRLSVLRRLAAKAKMESVVEWVQQRTDDGAKVVIAAHHRDVVDELANRFGGLKIQGGMSVEEVEEVKRKFQTDPKAQVITLSIQAAKTGHTLTAAQDIIFVELPWTPADVDQTYSRLHRMGQKGSVTATYALCAGTIDEEIYSLIASKRSVVTTAVDGGPAADDADLGVQLVLSLMNKV